MCAGQPFVKTHAVLMYYIVAFAISWGGMLIAIGGPGGMPGAAGRFERMIPLVALALLAGPTVGGIAMTGLAHGRRGYGDLVSRLLRWRVGWAWWLVALLAAPLVMIALPMALALLWPQYVPGLFVKADQAALLAMGGAMGLMAGVFEEVGWTGFALPALRQRYRVLTTGLIMGALWAVWHFPVNFWSSGTAAGTLALHPLLHSLIFSVGILPAFRVLMVWVYDRTHSLLLAMAMHASLTAGNIVLLPATAGLPLIVWSTVVAIGFWLVVAALAAKRQLVR